MEQVFAPNVGLRGAHYAGLCLQWVDDAGKAPNRTGTAKAAYRVEKNAGRLRTGEIPENVWVPVWFEFTRGSYTYPDGSTIYYKDAWHIALAKRTGNRYTIYDSEVARGGRDQFGGPYPALAAVESWFAVYGTKYVGWSTHCDGRQYAKERKGMNEAEARDMQNVLRVLNSEAKGWDRKKTHAGQYDDKEIAYLRSFNMKAGLAIARYSQQAWDEGRDYRKKKDQWQKDSEVNLPAAKKEIETLKKRIAELEKGDEFVKINYIYIKKEK